MGHGGLNSTLFGAHFAPFFILFVKIMHRIPFFVHFGSIFVEKSPKIALFSLKPPFFFIFFVEIALSIHHLTHLGALLGEKRVKKDRKHPNAKKMAHQSPKSTARGQDFEPQRAFPNPNALCYLERVEEFDAKGGSMVKSFLLSSVWIRNCFSGGGGGCSGSYNEPGGHNKAREGQMKDKIAFHSEISLEERKKSMPGSSEKNAGKMH